MSQDSSYRSLNKELEVVIEKLQSSDLDVDQIITEYQKGIIVIDELEKYLKSAQNKISRINPKNLKPKK
jgi:exodeoxyribonuclease VII small subunit